MNRITVTALEAILKDSEQCIAPGMGDVQLMVAEIRQLKAENETLVAAAQALRDEWRKDQADADRYRMVRGIASISASRRHLVVKRRPVNGFSSSTARDFDASIDAALGQGEQS